MKMTKETCCFCGKEVEGHDNSAWPIRDNERCCDTCNSELVIPSRLKFMKNESFRSLAKFVEIYDVENPIFVYGEYDNEKDAKEEIRVWHLEGYAIRWCACEVIEENYFTIAYADTKKELETKIDEYYRYNKTI
jgi:hypothetical protein